jgi:Arc/MetJ-type ribon-helix-helix transcriptional regulator
MSERVKRVTVTLPTYQYERIRAVMANKPDTYPTVSAFVTEAVSDLLGEEDGHETLLAFLREMDGEPTAEDREWAARAMELARRVAAEGHPGRPDAI